MSNFGGIQPDLTSKSKKLLSFENCIFCKEYIKPGIRNFGSSSRARFSRFVEHMITKVE